MSCALALGVAPAFAATTSTLEGASAPVVNRVSGSVPLSLTAKSTETLPIEQGTYALQDEGSPDIDASMRTYASTYYDTTLDWTPEFDNNGTTYSFYMKNLTSGGSFTYTWINATGLKDLNAETVRTRTLAGNGVGSRVEYAEHDWARFQQGCLVYATATDITIYSEMGARTGAYAFDSRTITGYQVGDTLCPVGRVTAVDFTPTSTISEVAHIYPIFANIESSVTVNMNGGGSNTSIIKYKDGTLKTAFPGNPASYNGTNQYEFVEWNTKLDGTGTKVTASSNFASINTIYAVWKYHITYHYDVNADASNSDPTKYTSESDTKHYVKGRAGQTIWSDPKTRTGYHASGWTMSSGSTVVSFSLGQATSAHPLSGSTNSMIEMWLYQQPNSHTVVYHANNPKQVDASTKYSQGPVFWNSNVTLTAFDGTRFHYFGNHFTGWNTKANGTGTAYTNEKSGMLNLTPENNAIVDLYAQWEHDVFTIELYANNGSDAKQTMTDVEFGDGVKLLRNTFVNVGYNFHHWDVTYYDAKGNGVSPVSGENVTTVNDADGTSVDQLCPGPGGTAKLVANWNEDNPVGYSVTYKELIGSEPSSDLRWCTEDAGYAKSYNVKTDAIKLADPSREGYTFAGWTVAVDNGKINASWDKWDDASYEGATSVTNATVVSERVHGLTVKPGNGTNGDGSTGTYGNLTITAHWTNNTYKITYKTNFGESREYLADELDAKGGNAVLFEYAVTPDKIDTLAIDCTPKKSTWYATSTFLGWEVTGDEDIAKWIQKPDGTLPTPGADGKVNPDEPTTNRTASVRINIGEDAYTGPITCKALWRHVQMNIEAPVMINFAEGDAYNDEDSAYAPDASQAYDVTSDTERKYIEAVARFKSQVGLGSSNHDYVIAEVECTDVASLDDSDADRYEGFTDAAGGKVKALGASGLLVTDTVSPDKLPAGTKVPTTKGGVVTDKDGNFYGIPVWQKVKKTVGEGNDASEVEVDKVVGVEESAKDVDMFWIANASTVADYGTSAPNADERRKYFGFGQGNNVINFKNGGLTEDAGKADALVINGSQGEAASVAAGEGDEIQWRTTRLYYGIDLSKCNVSYNALKNAGQELSEGESRVYKLVRLKFTFAPVAY